MSTNLLHLFHIVSPALPVGAYAYSQGLESAIDQGWLKDEKAIVQWLKGVMLEGVARLDGPVLLRCYSALKQQDWERLAYWNQWVLACRETRELLLEDQQLGGAMQRLLVSLDVTEAGHQAFSAQPAWVSQFALACVHWNIQENDALSGFFWAWLENQIAAATKIVPLGQTQAQKCLLELMRWVPQACDVARSTDDDNIGMSLPGQVMASAQHEHQYSRLFRS